MKLASIALFTALFSANLIAAESIVVKPNNPINCSAKENEEKYAHRIQYASISTDDEKVHINMIWEIGSCKTIITGNGHAAKFINAANFYRGNGESDIEDLEVKSKKVQGNGAVFTTISFNKAELETNKKFSAYFTYGLYTAVVKWNVEIFKTNNQKYALRFSR